MRVMSEPTTRPRLRAERPRRTERALPGSGYRPRNGSPPVALAAIAPVLAGILAGALAGVLQASPARAVEFGEGEFRGSLDTTLSHGVTFRIGERNPELASNPNGNDGNLNYDRGLVSNASKVTADLEVGVGRFGAFVRTTGFIDFENQSGTREYTPLSDAAKKQVGRDASVLDAYVTAAFDAGDTAMDLRLGKHVLNWGESTFIQNGINAINPFDVSKLRLPGSELREALIPVGLASLSISPTDTVSFEGFYQLDWEETSIDPVGSYFSVTDYAGPGADKAVIALPGLDLGDRGLTAARNPFLVFANTSEASTLSPLTVEDPGFLIAPRHADREPDDSGQWGVAFRYLAEELNHTEFGLYFMNYHSRLPVVSGHTGTVADTFAGLGLAGAIFDAAETAVEELATGAAAQAVTEALAAARCPSPAHSQECGIVAQTARQMAKEEALAQLKPLPSAAAQAAGIDAYAENGYYSLEYPEDIQLFGVSFNTEIGATGWALQGEWSFRRDVPLQLAERRVFADALEPFTGLIPCIEQRVEGGAKREEAGFICIGENAARGRYDADTVGYVRRNVSQVQATATRLFGPVMGSDSTVFLTEVAMMQVHDMPEGKGVGATELKPGDMPLESAAGGTLDEGKADADAISWGYRVAARLDYSNAIGAVNLYPYTQFLHDVSGNSPAPSGPFVEGRTALTLGIRADYLSRWEADIGFTRFAGKGNELSDRDFISASIKYSF